MKRRKIKKVVLGCLFIWACVEFVIIAPYLNTNNLIWAGEIVEEENSTLDVSLENAVVTAFSPRLYIRIKNRGEEACEIDRRFLLNVSIGEKWYSIPLRSMTREEIARSLESDRVYQEEDFWISLPPGEETRISFPVHKTYRFLKRGQYRLGVQKKGEKTYTTVSFRVV